MRSSISSLLLWFSWGRSFLWRLIKCSVTHRHTGHLKGSTSCHWFPFFWKGHIWTTEPNEEAANCETHLPRSKSHYSWDGSSDHRPIQLDLKWSKSNISFEFWLQFSWNLIKISKRLLEHMTHDGLDLSRNLYISVSEPVTWRILIIQTQQMWVN